MSGGGPDSAALTSSTVLTRFPDQTRTVLSAWQNSHATSISLNHSGQELRKRRAGLVRGKAASIVHYTLATFLGLFFRGSLLLVAGVVLRLYLRGLVDDGTSALRSIVVSA